MEGSLCMIFFSVLLCLIENFLPNPVKHNKLLEIVIKGLDGCGFGQMVPSGGSRQNLFMADVIFCLQRMLEYYPALNGSLEKCRPPLSLQNISSVPSPKNDRNWNKKILCGCNKNVGLYIYF